MAHSQSAVDIVTNRATRRGRVTRPIQYWRPQFDASIGPPEVARDAQRAFAEWKGERAIWLMPDLAQPCRWQEKSSSWTLALPGEHLERIDIFHIGENGYVRDIGPVLDGVLDAFLNVSKLGGLPMYLAPETRVLTLPRIENGTVRYQRATVWGGPSCTMPVKVDPDGLEGRVEASWPPEGRPISPISIDAESTEFYGPLEHTTYEGLPVVVSQDDPNFRSLRVIWRWPEPINGLFPWGGGGGDTLMHQALMREVAERSSTNLPGALRMATDAAAPYLSEGLASVADTWFWPLAQQVGVEQAILMGARFQLNDARTMEEVCESQAWLNKLKEEVVVARAYGPIGLLWSLMLLELESSSGFGSCRECGRILRGKRGKLLCNQKENLDCFKQRRAGDKRRARNLRPPRRRRHAKTVS